MDHIYPINLLFQALEKAREVDGAGRSKSEEMFAWYDQCGRNKFTFEGWCSFFFFRCLHSTDTFHGVSYSPVSFMLLAIV